MLKTKIENRKSTDELQIRVLKTLPYKASSEEYSVKLLREVLAEQQVTWTEIPLVDASLADQKNINYESFEDAFRNTFSEYLQNQQAILDLLALVDMGKYGKGLFAFKNIPKGTILGVYAGEIRSFKGNAPSEYALGMITNNTSSQHTAAAHRDDLMVIDALEYGNLTRYMQHLVNKDNKEYFFTDDLKAVQTANVELKVKWVEKVPVFYLIASEDIPENSIIGFDYTLQYWKGMNQQPAFFTQNGEEVFNCTPYKEWRSNVLNIAQVTMRFFQNFQEKPDEFDFISFWRAFTAATDDLIDEDKEIIEELRLFKIGEESLIDILKPFFSLIPEKLIQEDFERKVKLLNIPKTASADLTPMIKLLGHDSAFYALSKEITPSVIKIFDNMRKQVFGATLAQDGEFKLHLNALSSIEWKSAKKQNQYVFWSRGDKQKMDKVDEILTEHRIDHQKGQIKDTNDYSVQITKTF